jgi:hypothetical protein
MQTKEEKTTYEQLCYKEDSKEMSVKSIGIELSPGDVITTHNKTVFKIEEIILKRKALGKFKDEANRPDIYILRGEIISKVRWEMNQNPTRQKEINKKKAAEQRKAEEQEKSKPSTNWSEIVKTK